MIDFVDFSAKTLEPEFVLDMLHITKNNKVNNLSTYASSKGQFRNLIVQLKNDVVSIRGSLHKSFKDRTTEIRENASLFTISQLSNELNYLKELFKLNIEATSVKVFEFGLNIPVKRDPSEYLGSLTNYRGRNNHYYPLTTKYSNTKFFSRIHQGDRTKKILYNKNLDSKLPKSIKDNLPPTLRIEIRSNRLEEPFYPESLFQLADSDLQQQMAIALIEFVSRLSFTINSEISDYFHFSPTDMKKALMLNNIDQSTIFQQIDNLTVLKWKKKKMKQSLSKDYECIKKIWRTNNYKEEIILATNDAIHTYFSAS